MLSSFIISFQDRASGINPPLIYLAEQLLIQYGGDQVPILVIEYLEF